MSFLRLFMLLSIRRELPAAGSVREDTLRDILSDQISETLRFPLENVKIMIVIICI